MKESGIDPESSWGLSLFVLFEHMRKTVNEQAGSWGLSLFVLFECGIEGDYIPIVLEN